MATGSCTLHVDACGQYILTISQGQDSSVVCAYDSEVGLLGWGRTCTDNGLALCRSVCGASACANPRLECDAGADAPQD